ncbi:MAG: RDD family protein [Candidatus Woesearchaeota archaeon]
MAKKTVSLPEKTFVPASYWRRLFALVVDIVLLDLFVYMQFSFMFPKTLSFASFKDLAPDQMNMMMMGAMILTFFTLLYFVYQEKTYGQTLGQRIAQISIQAPKEATWRHHLINNFFLIPFFPFLLLWIIEPIYMFVKKERLLETLSTLRTVQEEKL